MKSPKRRLYGQKQVIKGNNCREVAGAGWRISLAMHRFYICIRRQKGKGRHRKVWSRKVQFSRSVMPDSLRPHKAQHTRPPCPLWNPGVYPNSCPLSWWGRPTISSSVIPFSSCPQSFPASGSFPRVSSLHQVAKVLEFQLQHQSFQWTLKTDL